MAPALKLIDFNKGRGWSIRIVLAIAEIPFEDIRVTREEVKQLASEGKLPFEGVPTLEIDGNAVSQTDAQLTYVAKLAGLYPSDPFVALKCDEVRGCLQDFAQLFFATFSEQDKDKKIARRRELIKGAGGRKLELLNNILSAQGKKFAVADELTLADVHIWDMRNFMCDGTLDGIPVDLMQQYGKLEASANAVGAHPHVRAYLRAHPMQPPASTAA